MNKYSTTIQELTVRLISAIDCNYNVVNMDEVLAVISSLEEITITRAQLEATRLAKYINQLRRNNRNDHLGRRAMLLLKKWREMVGIGQQKKETFTINPSNSMCAHEGNFQKCNTNAIKVNNCSDNKFTKSFQKSPQTCVSTSLIAPVTEEGALIVDNSTTVDWKSTDSMDMVTTEYAAVSGELYKTALAQSSCSSHAALNAVKNIPEIQPYSLKFENTMFCGAFESTVKSEKVEIRRRETSQVVHKKNDLLSGFNYVDAVHNHANSSTSPEPHQPRHAWQQKFTPFNSLMGVKLDSKKEIVKVPKKRGRKKGSKVIDAIVAKQSSLSTELLMRRTIADKKVKTTQELYADMKNRRFNLRIDQSSPYIKISSPLMQKQAQKYTQGSNIVTLNEDNNCVSLSNLFSGDESNFALQFQKQSSHVEPVIQSRPTVEELKEQLYESINKLPPLQGIDVLEAEYKASATPCTCTIVEVQPTVKEKEAQVKNYTSVEKEERAEKLSAKDSKRQLKQVLRKENEQSQRREIKHVVIKKPPEKSIFDLDFDNVDGFLRTLKAGAKAKTPKEDITCVGKPASEISAIKEVPSVNDCVVKASNNLISVKVSPQPLVPAKIPTWPLLQKREDDNCPAKYRYEIQTQQITEFQINALHNLYMPNMNGNWSETIGEHPSPHHNSSTELDNFNTVSSYGALVKEHLPRDLSNIDVKDNISEACTHGNVNHDNNGGSNPEQYLKIEPTINLTSDEHLPSDRWRQGNEDKKTNHRRGQEFAGWHQLVQVPSYNDKPFAILPYVLLD